jgi:hypothetical protein
MERMRNEYLQGVRIKYRNFRGLERKFGGRVMNQAGKRNFCVVLNEEQYVDLKEKGWQVKAGTDKDGEPEYTIKVNVSFGGRPPKIAMAPTDKEQGIMLDEETVGQLDFVDIENAEVVIRPYVWDESGQYGAAAYLRTLKVDIYVDPLEASMGAYDDEAMPFE